MMLGTFLDNLHFYTPSKLGHTTFSGGFVTVYHKRHWSQMFPHKYDRFVGKNSDHEDPHTEDVSLLHVSLGHYSLSISCHTHYINFQDDRLLHGS